MGFSFPNNPKNLDPSYKMDLDFLGLFRTGKKLPYKYDYVYLQYLFGYKMGFSLHRMTTNN